MAPSPCSTMNPGQGSQDSKPMHQKEETDTEGEEPQPTDMSTEKGYKLQRSSLPFSVESLISKKTTTCRTSYPPSDLALVLPKPGGGGGGAQGGGVGGAHFSPRTLYAERKVSAESSQGVSSSPSEDSPQFCDKDQSTWFQTSSFSTPPRKSTPQAPHTPAEAHTFELCRLNLWGTCICVKTGNCMDKVWFHNYSGDTSFHLCLKKPQTI